MVTGGNKGIGLEVCRQLADHGITVVLTARDQARGTAAVESLGRLPGDVIFHQLDVTDDQSAQRLADFLNTRFGKLDILARLVHTSISFHACCFRLSLFSFPDHKTPNVLPVIDEIDQRVIHVQVNNAAIGGVESLTPDGSAPGDDKVTW